MKNKLRKICGKISVYGDFAFFNFENLNFIEIRIIIIIKIFKLKKLKLFEVKVFFYFSRFWIFNESIYFFEIFKNRGKVDSNF